MLPLLLSWVPSPLTLKALAHPSGPQRGLESLFHRVSPLWIQSSSCPQGLVSEAVQADSGPQQEEWPHFSLTSKDGYNAATEPEDTGA